MAKVDFVDLFVDFLNAAKTFVPESDHVEMCTEVLRSFQSQGYNLEELYGIDEVIDDALGELYPELLDDLDYDDEDIN